MSAKKKPAKKKESPSVVAHTRAEATGAKGTPFGAQMGVDLEKLANDYRHYQHANIHRHDRITLDEFLQWKDDSPPPTVSHEFRMLTRQAYASQATRIAYGNRLAAHWRLRLGLEADAKESSSKLAERILRTLRRDYKRITDGMNSELVHFRNFKAEGIISQYAEYELIQSYEILFAEEERQFKVLEKALDGIPIWDRYLKRIQGCGARLAALLISEFNPLKAPSPSSFHRFAGLDVQDGKGVVKSADHCTPHWFLRRDKETGAPVRLDRCSSLHFSPAMKSRIVFVGATGMVRNATRWIAMPEDQWRQYPQHNQRVKSRTQAEFDALPAEHSARTYHAVIMTAAKASAGPEPRYVSHEVRFITSPYVMLKNHYKHRLQHSSKLCPTSWITAKARKTNPDAPDITWAETSSAHREAASNRYMMKQLLTDYWVAWRQLLGLPIKGSYAVEVLGKDPHHDLRLSVLDQGDLDWTPERIAETLGDVAPASNISMDMLVDIDDDDDQLC